MPDQYDIQGSCEVLMGGLPVANALMSLFVAQNTVGANNLAYSGFIKSGYLPQGLLDTNVAEFNSMWWQQGAPGGDTRDGNVAFLIQGEGHSLVVNAAMLMRAYMDPMARQALIDARVAQGVVQS